MTTAPAEPPRPRLMLPWSNDHGSIEGCVPGRPQNSDTYFESYRGRMTTAPLKGICALNGGAFTRLRTLPWSNDHGSIEGSAGRILDVGRRYTLPWSNDHGSIEGFYHLVLQYGPSVAFAVTVVE